MTKISIEQLANVTGGQKKSDPTAPSTGSANSQQKIDSDASKSPIKQK
jgi:bacteriocin-like protein